VSRDELSLPIDPDGHPVGVFDSVPGIVTDNPTDPQPRWWLHGLLLVATLITSTFMGALFYGGLPATLGELSLTQLVLTPEFIRAGLSFSIPLLLILLAHESGHYIAARRHGLSVTPPFFLPMPIPIFFYNPGTLGAVIRIREPIRSRTQLLDIGAWGPVAGFVVTVPVLVLGLYLSTAAKVPAEQSGSAYFGEPLLFLALARGLFFPGLREGWDILLHPVAWAGWWGLFVTSLNMLPFSQLDGGHVTYALFGGLHRRWAKRLLAILAVLSAVCSVWALWVAILILIGPEHPPVADEDRSLDARRKALGWAALVIFVLSFSFIPLRLIP
jgi:hypothetical protein